LLVLIAVLWLATRPYEGVVGDARLYMVQALRHLDPASFAQDLYFRFGSQDEFTIFSRSYAPLLSMFGVGATGIILTVAGQFLWLGGLLYLARGLIRDRWQSLLSVAAAVALPAVYAVWYTGYGEPFATPRLYAEALSLIALGLLVRHRIMYALAILAGTVAIHPLMTLPALAFVFIYIAFQQPLWWFALIGAGLVPVCLSLAGVPPFANLLTAFDPVWLQIVQVRDGMCFAMRWPLDTFFRMANTILMAVFALLLTGEQERRFIGVALVVGIGGAVCTFVGADLAHNVFIAEIQPYRSMWILSLLANFYALPMFLRLNRQGDAANLTKLGLLAGLAATLLCRFLPCTWIAPPLMIATVLYHLWQTRSAREPPFPVRLLFLVLIAAGGAMAALIVHYGFKGLAETWPERFYLEIYSLALVIGGLTALAMYVLHLERRRPSAARIGRWLSIALLPAALFGWDVRTPWTKFVESPAPAPASLASLLPQKATVYWDGGIELLWLRLQRSSYFSCTQGTGAVFFRGTAIAYRHRAESFWPFRTLDFGESQYCPDPSERFESSATRQDLVQLCRNEPELDVAVFGRPVEDMPAQIWDAPASLLNFRMIDGEPTRIETSRFYLYSCAGLRQASAGATGTVAGPLPGPPLARD
jgi:hypothetical protein